MPLRNDISDLIGHARGIMLTALMQPACWVFFTASIFIWDTAPSYIATGTLVIAFSDYLFRQSIWFRAYAIDAEHAINTIDVAQEGYSITICRFEDIYPNQRSSISGIIEKPVDIFLLRPKQGFEEISNLRAFLQPAHALVFLPESPELSTVEKFCLLHELGHASRVGYYQNLSSVSCFYRLFLWYFPLIAMTNSIVVVILIFSVFAWHYVSDTNGHFVELEADWTAYRLYKTIFGLADLRSALGDIKNFFKLKAVFEEEPKIFLIRANAAKMYRYLIFKKNPTQLQKMVVDGGVISQILGNIHLILAMICAIIVCFTVTPKQPDHVVLVFSLMLVPHLLLVIKSKNRWTDADQKLWTTIMKIKFQDIIGAQKI